MFLAVGDERWRTPGQRLPVLSIPKRLILLLGVVASGCGSPASPPSSPTARPFSAVAPPSEWPMYGHDVSHTSTNSGEKALSKSNLSSLAAAWQVPIGSSNGIPSNSTPSLLNGRVYVGSSVGTGPNFLAFDAKSGAPVWSANVGYEYTSECGPGENVGVPSTAALSGSTLVVGGGDAAYYGLDEATGAVVWRQALGTGPSGYAWASPAIMGGIAYYGASSQCDNPPVAGKVLAVKVADGSLVGVQSLTPPNSVGGGGVWQSPALSPDGATLVLATGEDDGDDWPYEQAIVTLNAQTLQLLQSNKEGAPGNDLDFGTSPVVFHGSGGRLMTGASSKNGVFYAYDLDSLSSGPAWSRTLGVVIGMAPAYDPGLGASGTLFVTGTVQAQGYNGGNAAVYALDPDTGRDVWPAAAVVGNCGSNLAIANGMIFVNTGATGVAVLDESSGSVLKSIVPPNPGPVVSGVVVAEGGVFFVSGSYLNAWRVPGS